MLFRIKQWLALAGLAFLLSACSQSDELISLQIDGKTMGTYYQIKVVGTQAELANAEYLSELIEAELKQVNQEMSTYQRDSELSLFNQSQGESAITVSANLALVIAAAIDVSEQSNGAFDATVGPLVNLWGFGPDKRPEKVPSDETLELAKQAVGYNKIILQGNQLSKLQPDLYIDLSAIAKGHGVDRVAAVIAAQGFENYMVDIGGELSLKGHNDQQNPWTIAVEKPQIGAAGIQKVIQPGDYGLATSGDYRNYYEFDGIRYSHTIDPRTGKPISNHIVSVTVVTENSMMADAYATALTVMGVEAAMEYAATSNLAVYIVEKQGNEFVEHISSAFQPMIIQTR